MTSRNKLLAFGAATLLAVGVGTYAFTASSQDMHHGMMMGPAYGPAA